ncbi:MAG TPA: hypothetical protein IAD24_05545 [Candidatus Aphodomorpha intestinavium]|uniref:Uncharacterized protein n=1 Tax=Candidatus Aphodomorpha intestinavium TaxID=2840672 RepID=A0A9D1N4N7_9FIRM|nr:hypothetical protein [Candidatus Aphodomorpha intestinavium]
MRLFLEPPGGVLEVRVRCLVPLARLRFRLHLFSAPYLTAVWLRRDGSLRTVYRAGEQRPPPGPWANAALRAAVWRGVHASVALGGAEAPAASALGCLVCREALLLLLRRFLTEDACVSARPDAQGALFRLKVAGMVSIRPVQIIVNRLQMQRRGSHAASH